MAAGVAPGEYKDLVLFLATAGIVVPLFQRLKISPDPRLPGGRGGARPFGLGALGDRFPGSRA